VTRSEERKLEKCRMAAKIAIKYGPPASAKLTERDVEEYLDESISHDTLYRTVSSKNIKWYIHHMMKIDHPIWNGDFIAGITKCGTVNWSKTQYPTFTWWGSPLLVKVFKECPYYGKIKNGRPQKKQKHPRSWQKVPALYLKPNYDSMSYVAGLLCTGRLHRRDGRSYMLYQDSVIDELVKLGIPVEDKIEWKVRQLISPFWPALFTKFMPECCQKYFTKCVRPHNGNIYAAILWLTYCGHKIKKGGIPYLQSRRAVFYKFRNEDGTLRNLQRMWMDYDLVGLDRRIRDCIGIWYNESV